MVIRVLFNWKTSKHVLLLRGLRLNKWSFLGIFFCRAIVDAEYDSDDERLNDLLDLDKIGKLRILYVVDEEENSLGNLCWGYLLLILDDLLDLLGIDQRVD